ncbi:hypothetical protein ACFQGE_00130 [Halomicroarcula sp. GCM10025817]|uniref:hypothetical protein n=1 Tax=Haloarcula TaxID=2237 RepID=UPI0023E867D9|nr:hypothetical protein [Halomicroarcula sp. SYNS111]
MSSQSTDSHLLHATVSREVLDAIVAPETVFDGSELLRVKPEGIEIHATDKARAAIADVAVSSAAFDAYRAEPMETGIDLAKVSTFLDLVSWDAVIDITITEAQTVVLSADGFTYRFQLIDPETVTRPFDESDIEHVGEVTLSGHELSVPLNLAEIAGDQIAFSVDGETDVFSGWVDTERDSFHFEFGSNDLLSFSAGNGSVTVALDYLVEIEGVIPRDVPLCVRVDEFTPVQLRYPVADGCGHVEFTLAYH